MLADDQRLPPPVAVLAFGGNALIRPNQLGTAREQRRSAHRAARSVLLLLREGYRVLLVHGNGPQVGRELIRSEEAVTKIPPQPLDGCVASTQGSMGHELTLAIRNVLKRAGLRTPVSAVLTQALVSTEDRAFAEPTKPVGPFFGEWRAKELMRGSRWRMVEDAGRGWRRVVPSPQPLDILGFDTIETLLDAGHVVLAAGGGGVPVAVDGRGDFIGAEAVIDKDRTAALLANYVGAQLLVLLTAVDHVYINFGRTDQETLEHVGADDLRVLHEERQFAPGSMGPKVEAALTFLDDGGDMVLITSADKLAAALANRAGTRITQAGAKSSVRRQLPLFSEGDAQVIPLFDDDSSPFDAPETAPHDEHEGDGSPP